MHQELSAIQSVAGVVNSKIIADLRPSDMRVHQKDISCHVPKRGRTGTVSRSVAETEFTGWSCPCVQKSHTFWAGTSR